MHALLHTRALVQLIDWCCSCSTHLNAVAAAPAMPVGVVAPETCAGSLAADSAEGLGGCVVLPACYKPQQSQDHTSFWQTGCMIRTQHAAAHTYVLHWL